MRSKRILSPLVKLVGSALILGSTALTAPLALAEPLPDEKACGSLKEKSKTVNGWCVAINRRLGNCLGCHMINTADWPEGFPPGGNAAPPLVAMKARFPDRDALTAQIYDARDKNPDTAMPPFGAHGVLTDAQIDDIVEFLHGI